MSATKERNEIIGMKLRIIREAAGFTQQDVAERIGVSHPNVSDWERGVRSPSTKNAVRLAKILKVRLEDFLT